MPHISTRIRPAGNRINLTASRFSRDNFTPFEVDLYQSGTSALAAAVLASIRIKNAGGYRQPEILIPAYGCPDLVSAIVYAGAKPVLVDLEPQLPWMSINDLTNKINENTVAIVAVNFLGIRERMDQLSSLCRNNISLSLKTARKAFQKSIRNYIGRAILLLSALAVESR